MPPPDACLRPALAALAHTDPDVARVYAACGLPPVRRQPPGFVGLVRIIAGQQLSVYAAAAIIGRLEALLRPLTPQALLGADDATLRAIGFSRQKIAATKALAGDLAERRLDLDALAAQDDDTALRRLCRTRGVGPWTAQIYLLFALRRPDVWPADDLALRVAAQRLKGLDARPDRAQMLALGEAWRPHRSAAARLLWHSYRHAAVVSGGDVDRD